MRLNEEVFSLDKMGLRGRLYTAFTFAALVPTALIFYYVANSYKISALAVYALVSVILAGWWFVFDTFSAIIKINNKARDALRRLEEHSGAEKIDIRNEIERLDTAFSMLSSKVKESVGELEQVNSKTEELSRTIGKKVKILSSILDADVLFSKSAPSTEILQFLTERLKEIIQTNIIVSFFRAEREDALLKFYYGISERRVEDLLNSNNMNELMNIKNIVIADEEHKDVGFSFIVNTMGVKNFIINPVYLRKEIAGFVIAGNSIDNFVFPGDISDILNLFSYNMSITWEREILYRRIEDLEINDPLTGLYNRRFFANRLDEEIKRSTAYQRPCGLVAVRIGNYSDCKQKLEFIELERILKRMVQVFKDNLRPIDILGRVGEDSFGVIVIERNRRQSNYVGARLKEAVYNFLKEALPFAPVINIAVAESPIDGTDAAGLFECIHRRFEKNEI